MAYGNCVIANATPENEEVLGDAGLYYPKNDFVALAGILQKLNGDPSIIRKYGDAARKRALSRFDWEKIADEYEALLCKGE